MAHLTSGSTYTLVPGALGHQYNGDISWAWEWDKTLAGAVTKNGKTTYSSFQISEDRNITAVPEPGILLLLGSDLAGLAAARKRLLAG